jgi:hypothetical protein
MNSFQEQFRRSGFRPIDAVPAMSLRESIAQQTMRDHRVVLRGEV